MKASKYFSLVAVVALVAALWARSAAADMLSCKRALNKAGTKYIVAVSKAKAAEARGRLPGHKAVPPHVTAAKIGSALEKAKAMVAAGCAGISDPSSVDPKLCPEVTNFDECIGDFSVRADVIVNDLQAEIRPQEPICLDQPTCLKGFLPLCDEAKGCACHDTAEGLVKCINAFRCAGAEPCSTSLDCPLGKACYVNTCCGPPVCGPTTCQLGGGAQGGGLTSTGTGG